MGKKKGRKGGNRTANKSMKEKPETQSNKPEKKQGEAVLKNAAAEAEEVQLERETEAGPPQSQNLDNKVVESSELDPNPIIKESENISSSPQELPSEILTQRKDVKELEAKGILPGEAVAPSLAATAVKLEKKIRKDSVHYLLETRPEKEELNKQGILPTVPNLSASLQGMAVDLERNLTKNQLSQKLDERHVASDLESANILPKGASEQVIAPSIQAKRKSLERQLNADNTNHLLETRPDVDELEREGILKGKMVADKLQPIQQALKQEMTKDKVNQLLESRPDITELENSGIAPDVSKVSPSIQSTRRELDNKLKRDSLSRRMSERPSREELQNIGVPQGDEGNKGEGSNVSNSDVDASSSEDDDGDDEFDDSDESDEYPEGEATIGSQRLDYLDSAIGNTKRDQFAIAFKAALRLRELGMVDATGQGMLKDLIVSEDYRIMAAVEIFALDGDVEEMLDSFYRILRG